MNNHKQSCITAHAVVSYIYNTSGVDFVRDIFGEVHPDYLREKAELWANSPAAAIGFLDWNNFQKFVQTAISRCGNASENWWDANEGFAKD
jgi:hypothetical protein